MQTTEVIREAHRCTACGKNYSTGECRQPAPDSDNGIQGRCACGEYYDIEHPEGCTQALIEELKQLDIAILTMRANYFSRFQYSGGSRRNGGGLHQQSLRAKMARRGDRRADIVEELKRQGVDVEAVLAQQKEEALCGQK